jgi:hypothetical protein
LVAEKYGSRTKPVLRVIQCRWLCSRSQMAAVLRSCQTKAGAIGRPVARSQTIVVSR